jgi:hypothetical protein
MPTDFIPRSPFVRSILATLFVALLSPTAHAQPLDVPDGIIAGEVVGGLHRPLAGATITTTPPTRSITSDSSGHFVLDGIPTGRYRVTVARDGANVSFDVRARASARPVTVRLPIWRLAWADEFDSTAVDLEKWEQPEGGTGVEEHRVRFRRSAMNVSGGRLRITTVPDSIDPGYYTGGMLLSRERFLYGRFEARAKLPTGRGLWPAVWLWRDHEAPEIDIMELLGKNPNKVHLTYHYGNHRGTRRSRSSSYSGPDFSQAYHRFALEWYPNEYVWFVDDIEVYRTPVTQPDVPLSFVLDTIVGGNWGGYPDESTVFPQFHDIDYARVYTAVE